MTFKPSENSGQPGHLPSLPALWVAEYPTFLYADSEDSDQTSLIRVFTGHTGHFVGFVVCWLKWGVYSEDSNLFAST